MLEFRVHGHCGGREAKQCNNTSLTGSRAKALPLEERKKQEGLDLVLETVKDLLEERSGEEKVWGSMVKQALKRRKPGFNESDWSCPGLVDT